MSRRNWDFLKNLPFGMVVFASPGPWDSEAVPLPTLVNDGDLDGDNYLICWDDELLGYITMEDITTSQSAGDDVDSLVGTDFVLTMDGGKQRDAVVSMKVVGTEPPKYIVEINNGGRKTLTQQEIIDGRDEVSGILNHRLKGQSTMVEVLWKHSEQTSWHRLRDLKLELSVPLVEYARNNKLSLEENGWEWLVRDAQIVKIMDHRHEGKSVDVQVLWDSGEKTWEDMNEIKNDQDDKPLLVEYARKDKTRLQDCKWARSLLREESKNWLERAQDNIADIRRLRDYDQLTTTLYTAYKRAVKNDRARRDDAPEDYCSPESEDYCVLELGRAYKRSNDIAKHGGTIELPVDLRFHVKNKALQKYLF
jgi:hypothetical protein